MQLTCLAFLVRMRYRGRLAHLLCDSEPISRIKRGRSTSNEIVVPRAPKLEKALFLTPVFLPVSYSLLIKKAGQVLPCPVNYFLLLVES